MAASTGPRPASPPSDSVVSGLCSRWKGVRVRTLVRYLVVACVAMVVMVVVSFNRQMVQEYIYLDNGKTSTTTKPFSRRELHELHIQRRDMVQEVCQHNAISSSTSSPPDNIKPSRFKHIYVDDKHKFLWCSVPKVACTNFKRLLLILSGKVNTTNPADLASADVHGKYGKYLTRLDEFTPQQIKQRIRDYYKFMFVRDPLERILSAYVNKFTMKYNNMFRMSFGRTIIRNYRESPSKEAIKSGSDVTFNEFVRYLLDPAISEPFNEHWLHFYKLCSPCLVQYDTIGKYETMGTDIDYVLDELGVRRLVSFPKGKGSNGKGKTTHIVKNYYTNITSELIHHLWELYSVDYSMFGYPYPEVLNDQ